ncbi:tetraspanin family protein (macronuclear) [Tetrahymena thermophila SB210]|uniref:Tetraspanin family protein n=1 Tax=Tetrahymena thermophila (strain SB210) TaxID=312017 RepID=Q235P9_TETTS|nr:tetraspanin family protein [Tetrahymena thermophila SB210]EAR92231.2 tetraspanin family protein [Tetrahymena thermophila SB210]|eukprot:XP_001012476.2 tetraspanin family protein [Tetrahymena thermophila SB210]
MGCCEGFVKIYLLIGCFFDAALGIACIVLSAYASKVDEDLFYKQNYKDYKKDFCIALYVLGGVTIATGILGAYGFLKKMKCLQSIFIILNIIYCAAFAAIFGLSIYAKNYINDQMTDSQCLSGDMADYNTVFEQLQGVWCNIDLLNATGSVSCPCLATNLSQWSDSELQQIRNTKKAFKQNTNWVPIPTETVLTCNYFIEYIAQQKADEIKLLEAVERNFKCTGVCSGDLVYYFNDINSGRPDNADGCYHQIRDKLIDWSGYIYIISIIIAVITFLNVFLAFVNCCIGNKPQNYSETKRVEQY